MTIFSDKCPEDYQKRQYKIIIDQVFKVWCRKCKSKNIKQIGRWRFECNDCKQGMTFKKSFIQKNGGLFKDMSDSNNWKSTCEECGGIMDYYNFRYWCRKCGNILEV